MVRGDTAKLHALFWTTPVIPRGSHSPYPKEPPVWVVHPAGPSKTECRVVASSWRLSVNGLDTLRPLRQEHSHSLTHLNVPGTGHHPPVSPAQMGLKIPGLPLQGSPARDPWWLPALLQSVFQCQLCPLPPQGGATQQAKRPWKWVSWSFLYIFCDPMGSQLGAEFQRMGLVGGPWGRSLGIYGALLKTESKGGQCPPLTISSCSPLFTLIRIGGSTLHIPIASPVIATWCISANPEGVPQEGPPTSSINTVSPPSVNKWYDRQPGGFLLPPFKPSSCPG